MAAKTCRDCPSYLTSEAEQRSRFGKAVGAPMCARFGHVLGHPGSDNEHVAIKYASSCDAYGDIEPASPVSITPRVVTPDLSIIAAGETDTPCSTCTGCSNMVTSNATQRAFGWPVNLCRAKGTLIFKPMSEAKGCDWSRPGAPTEDTDGLNLLPEFDRGFAVSDDVLMGDELKSMMAAADIEPSTMETEAPVAASDKGVIRAWFKVTNSENGEDHFLPIFDPAYFSEEERALIPKTGDEEHPELYVDHANLLATFAVETYALDESLCLIGAPGSGKTEFARYAAWRMQLPFIRLSLTDNTDPEDFLGGKEYDPDVGTYNKPGRLPRAWTRPCVVVSDEFNVAPDAIMQVYRPLTDNSKQLIIEDDVFERHEYCFHLLTMNPSWDSRNVGTKEMADADGNRLSFQWVPEPPAPVLRHILKSRCAADGYDIPEETLKLITAIGEDLREASTQGIFPGTWGIRQEVKVARKTAHYGLVTAYRRAVLDSLDPETASLVVKMIESHVDPDKVTTDPF